MKKDEIEAELHTLARLAGTLLPKRGYTVEVVTTWSNAVYIVASDVPCGNKVIVTYRRGEWDFNFEWNGTRSASFETMEQHIAEMSLLTAVAKVLRQRVLPLKDE